jgi:hypothetical protein
VEGEGVSSAPNFESIPLRVMSAYFSSPSSWTSLTQLRNFVRLQGSSNSTDNSQQLQYNYIPTEWVCITFLALFGVSTCRSLQLHPHIDADKVHCSDEVFHTVQAIRSRLWWLFPSAVFCGVLELIGWSGREWSSHNPFIETPYIIQ